MTVDARQATAGITQPQSAHGKTGKLAATGLRKSYGGRTVVKDVSVDVNSGEVVGLLGPNGAGKTTCFYMIVGLVPADAGQISIDSEVVTPLPIHQRARRGLSYLPQDASVFRRLSVEDNIRAVLELQRDERDKPLKKPEIDARLDSLLDEPFAGVDPIAVIEIQRIVRFLKGRGIGVLITDHNVRETLGICDRAYIISEGTVLAAGHPDEIVVDPAVRRVYLGEHFKM